MSRAARALVGLGFIAAFSSGVVLGRLIGVGEQQGQRADLQIRENASTYTNPLLECEIADERLYAPLRLFTTKLIELVGSLEQENRVNRIAVYFRDLNNGPWIGHREKERFIPASLAKLPIVIACYRQAESHPGFLAAKIVFTGLEAEREPGFANPESNLRRGQAYTVDELIQRVAKYSDNAAATLLAQALPPRLLQNVYFQLGIDPQRLKAGEFSLSPREYGAFFRVLFNASYLSKSFSEQALSYLDQSTFELGLVAGVPPGTPVAHKFGVWEQEVDATKPSQLQLHDCGIVYHPQRPYLLCVMTAGDNYVQMAAAVAAVSRLAYQEVDRSLVRPGDWDALPVLETASGIP